QDYDRVAARMIDRTCQLLPRLALIRNEALAQMDGVRDLRVGLRVLDLRGRRPLPPGSRDAIAEVLEQVAAHFRRCDRARRPLPPPASLCATLDACVRGLLGSTDAAAHDAVQALAGLRLALFPESGARESQEATVPLAVAHSSG
ncbi:MAG TPA: FUSC family protein, partial [Dokdonella sp.]